MAVWSNIAAAPLVGATMLVYFAVCLLRTPRRILGDALVLGGTAVVLSGALMLASGLLIGPVDYILPTLKADSYLDLPAVTQAFHSTNPRWILLRPYLLVPLLAVCAWGATFLRRLRDIPTPQLLIGGCCVAQITAFGCLQFLGDAEVLQQHYYSSSLWSAVCLVLAITVCHLAKPLLDRRWERWLPAVLVLAVPLVYETDPHVPAIGWWPRGLEIVAAVIVAAAIGRFVSTAGAQAARATAVAVVVAVSGCALVLTVAPYEPHAPLRGVVDNPVPAYATALGGSTGDLIDRYRVATELPQFVGNSTYPGERLLMWFPQSQLARLIELIGMYHANINELSGSPPVLSAQDKAIIAARKPAEILIFDTSDFPASIGALAPYDPALLRAGVLKSGDFVVRSWLVSLGVYLHARQPR
jgi:hypothetical protein